MRQQQSIQQQSVQQQSMRQQSIQQQSMRQQSVQQQSVQQQSIQQQSMRQQYFQHTVNDTPIEAVQQQRDLGFVIAENLKHDKPTEKTSETNVLKVYRLVPELPLRHGIRPDEDEEPPKVKLECLATYVLHDCVASMVSVKLNPRHDSLFLAFKDARLSVVEYDHHMHDLKTTSLHYFETQDLKGGYHFNHALPLVRVDPDTRCAAMLIYSRKIVVLPFRRDLATDTVDYNNPLHRGPIMQSYVIDPKEFDTPSIDNILDIQFLHGYYDPTLMVLYEPIKTFPGRVAVRQDTCAIAALSLNLRQRLNPVIWHLSGLPHDCASLLPVPKPIGGVLLFAHNSLTYLTQSVPPYGISLNAMADKNTNFPLRKQEGVTISLDNCRAAFLAEDRLVVSLKGGELYVVTLGADSMRAVRSFHFDKAASSVLTCCVSVCEDQYLFLGSRLGNSLLLRYQQEAIGNDVLGVEPGAAGQRQRTLQQPPSKRKKMDTLGDWIASDVDAIEDVDILEVYGPEDTATVQLSSYTFEVMDSLLNIGPCGDMGVGEPAFLSEEYDCSVDPCVEILTTSGHGKNGALSVLQRAIKPQVLTTFELPGVHKMWTVYGSSSSEGGRRKAVDPATTDHSYLILAREASPLILHTQEEISELEDSGFDTSQPTIFATNIGNYRYIVQVRQFGVKLLDGSEELQDVEGLSESPLVCATVADPHLVVLAEDGTVAVLTLHSRPYPRLVVTKSSTAKRLQLQTLSAYCDVSGLFTTLFPDDGVQHQKIVKTEAELKKELDDEDEMLYGNTATSVFDPPTSYQVEQQKPKNKWWQKFQKEHRPTYWVAGIRANGVLEIYSLPEMRLCFAVKDFPYAHRVLVDSSQGPPAVDFAYPEDEDDNSKCMPTVHELLLVGMGHRKLRPVLFARIGEDVVIYEAFQFSDNLDVMQLKLRFRKVESHRMLLRLPKGTHTYNNQIGLVDRQNYFTAFSNVSVYNGVFISGPAPHWVLLTVRGEFRFHPMSLDGGVKCFAPFRNVNCQNGFLYFNDKVRTKR
ncbi:hypothetical protein FHG87_000497 [Trinorchestia longiramus]|nr:hypothetical protein FHG87_000497 [Trinorchestia longiramus]